MANKNRILGRSQNKSNKITSLKTGENLISDPNTIAETFNEYFSTIGEKIANSVDSGKTHFSSFIRKPATNFEFNTVSVDKVLHSFLTLSSSKATGSGIDKIPIKILKLSANIIAPSMTKLFNYSVLNGVFPYDWKIAKVIPFYKKGLKTMLDNYRPISILPPISKAMKIYFMTNYMAIYPTLAFFQNINLALDDIILLLLRYLTVLSSGIQIWTKG